MLLRQCSLWELEGFRLRANPGRDIFLDMLEIELALPSDAHIREVMEAEAQKQGLQIGKSRLAELQLLAGRNPMLAQKIIKNEALGLKQDKPEHTQYVVIMPIILACLMSFGIVRFIGMGTGNKSLYIFGGVSLVTDTADELNIETKGRSRFLKNITTKNDLN